MAGPVTAASILDLLGHMAQEERMGGHWNGHTANDRCSRYAKLVTALNKALEVTP